MKKVVWLSLGILFIASTICILFKIKAVEVNTAINAYKDYEVSEIDREKDSSTYTLHR
nr:hypothetical protein [uncultured Cellulosilyticum sp.]